VSDPLRHIFKSIGFALGKVRGFCHGVSMVFELREKQHHPHHHHKYRVFLWISISGAGGHRRTRYYLLEPNRRLRIMSAVTVGHTITYTWQFVDANGNPPPAGTPAPTADSATFTDVPATPPVDTFTPSGGPVEASAVLAATAAGSDTVTLAVAWTPSGGTQVTFTASDVVTISAAPFVPAGVQLMEQIV
jgi:hypothetical protein